MTCSVGTHPHHADEELDVTADDLIARTSHPKVVAIGEAGLDYHYDNSPRDAQEQGFRTHIAAARATQLPLVIHAREADADTARILEEEAGKGPFPAVLHCYTGGPELARRALALGHYIGFTGIVTFKNSAELREIAQMVPPDRFLIETDAPFLAPLPYRGKRNEPAYVVKVAETLAEVRGVSLDELARQTTENFFRLFAKVPRRGGGRRMSLTFTILGCGSSGGVPRPGTGWGACDPANPKNRRRRCSLLIERTDAGGTTRVLIDTGPDLRDQLIDADVNALDAVIYSHEHADHTHGIDDLRGLFLKARRRVDVYADDATSRMLMTRFSYCFVQPAGSDYPPIATMHALAPGRALTIDGKGGPVTLLPFMQEHGDIRALGFRIGNLAYSSDLHDLPAESVSALGGLKTWIVDALRYHPHPSHFSVSDALAWIERLKPKRAILTNMHTDLDYEVLRQSLPPHVVPAYDGMRVGETDIE